MHCYSAFVDFSHIKNLFSEPRFNQFLNESKKPTAVSQHSCIICKNRMGLHFMGKDIHVESCYRCQKIWFDPSEIRKFQEEYDRQINNQVIYKTNHKPDVAPNTEYLLEKNPYLWMRPITPLKLYMFETSSNYAGNRLSENKIFKKYPIFTFFLIIGIYIAYVYWKRHR
jgi:Zn-finger nucleic acid-binding protein